MPETPESFDLANPELVGEYLESLQDQIDALRTREGALVSRIEKLERERELLRSRLPRRKRPRPSPEPQTANDRSLLIPGVGSIADVPLPEGPVARPGLKVAAVLDQFSEAAFKYEVDLLNLPGQGWDSKIEEFHPDLLLVESAYRGADGRWAGKVARFGSPSTDLSRLVDWCRSNGIPTVFWVKEDPINHDWFTASASLFDVVVTVDANMVDRYSRSVGVSRVDVLQFGAQPAIHHPGPDSQRLGSVAFAGSYYATKHPERRAQMEMLLGPAIDHGLHIFDRMSKGDPRFEWPERYRSHIVGSLTYPQTLEAYRRYRTFFNVNTVTESPTMCARRVYELLASGTRVISGPSAALNGVPVLVAETSESVDRYLEDGSEHDPGPGFDWVNDGNLMTHRVDKILDLIS